MLKKKFKKSFKTDSNISHNEFVLIDNMLKAFYDMKEEIKNSNNN